MLYAVIQIYFNFFQTSLIFMFLCKILLKFETKQIKNPTGLGKF